MTQRIGIDRRKFLGSAAAAAVVTTAGTGAGAANASTNTAADTENATAPIAARGAVGIGGCGWA